MIAYSPTAAADQRALENFYHRKNRPAALANLYRQLTVAIGHLESGTGRRHAAPASFRSLAKPGIAWLKVGPYWIVHLTGPPPVILRIFHEASDFAAHFTQ